MHAQGADFLRKSNEYHERVAITLELAANEASE